MAVATYAGWKLAAGLGGAGVLVVGLGLVAKAINDDRQKQQRWHARVTQAKGYVLSAIHQVAHLFDGWRPEVVFDAGCQNASWDGARVCVSTSWALNELTASCRDAVCTRNRVYAVVAHECGHAVDPTLRQKHPWDDELFADNVSGWAMGMLGIDPGHIIDEMRGWTGTATHPPGEHRVRHIADGYHRATGVVLAV